MKPADELDRVLKGEAVEASQPVRELAELAALLQGAWQDGPTPAAADRGRAAALATFAAAPTIPIAPVHARPSRGRRVFARVALVAALVAGLPTAAWAASEGALPGEILYPLKRGFEETRLILAGDAADEAAVLLGMAEERMGEAVLGLALGEAAVVDQALVGYDDAMLRFEARIVEAQAEGLPVEALLEEAAELTDVHDQVFETPAEPTPTPPEVSIAPSGDKGGKAKGNGGGKPGNEGNNGGNKPNRGNGNGNGNGSGGSSSSQGGGGGGAAGGGGNGGGGGEDAKQEDPPQPAPEEDDDDDEDEDSEEGLGLGHEKAKGEGHHKDKGEGHDHD